MTHYVGYEKYRKHWLFKIARSCAMSNANNLCEQCGEPATEAHHRQYPAWGAFDTPSNMLALCHECHKKTHNKRN